MKFIGFRTVKTAIGASLAIIIGKELGLQYAASAGIITILSVQKTRKKSVKSALKRILSCILALCLALILFNLLGYGEIIFGVFLLIFIPLAVRFKVEEGIVVSSVLVSHLLVEQSTSAFWLWNEVALMIVGVTVALILNLYMPSVEGRIKEDQLFIEESIKEILIKIAEAMRNGEFSKEDEEDLLIDLENRLRGARKLTYINLNNYFRGNDHYYVRYMEMRMQQLETLKSMKEHFRDDFSTYEQALMMADFTEKVANSIYEENTAENLLNDLYRLRENFRSMSLPVSRQEFESRASLFQFLNDIKQFLRVKNEFIIDINMLELNEK
ncbi:aromatic acid exporter family protein [Clostridium sp. MSJ-11]|uniref:Aromatic acid exporter family protein n=1 Tax=Clostridium mobile TaxID=2841512 RepID=A0ABS6EHK3_9CLOT|nr:aromatic acid exporter family protein [Clostridium mobile]MBU5484686.1 aromatic acid exporter family protein [Clostridium mobile]